MANKLLKAAAALLLAGVSVGSFAACTFETPEWAEQALCDHVFDEKEILEEPTCGSSGTALKICTECGKTKHVTLSATGKHEFSEWEETTPPTSETPGEKTRTCNVCGKTEKEELPVQDIPEVQVHPDENFDNICDDCGEDIFANATYSAVNAGDRLSGGWYRISALGWDGSDYEFSIGQVVIKLSYDSFTYEPTWEDEPVSVEEVGDHLITITANGHCMVTDVTASASIKHTGDGSLVKDAFLKRMGLLYRNEGVFIYISEDCYITDHIHFAGFSFSGVNLVESSHQLEKVHH